MKKRTGFTLIEILIAIFILTVVISTVYAAYTGTFRIIKNSEYDSEIYGMVRIAMERIARDLEAISAYRGTIEFVSRPSEVGSRDNLDIAFKSNAHLIFDDKSDNGSVANIRYNLEEDKEKKGFRLLREDMPDAQNDNKDIQKAGFVVCDRIHSVNYKFYDAKGNEYDSWDSHTSQEAQKDKSPAMVSITLNMINPDNDETPYIFTTKIFIPLSQGGS